MLGEGHIRMFGTLELGHTVHPGVQRLQCWPSPDLRYYGSNREEFVFIRPPGVESFVLSKENVWYEKLSLIFTLSIQIDGQVDPVDLECAFISVLYDIKLEPFGE
jgi:hypothetical protein